jgi:hypothetical protein
VRLAHALEDLFPVARECAGDVRLPRAVQIVNAPFKLVQCALSGLAIPLKPTIYVLLSSA